MTRHLPVFVAVLFCTGAAAAQGQSLAPPLRPIALEASAAGGRLYGVVRDDAGRVLDGVSVLAMGTTLAAVKSDGRGEFNLMLPIGDYVLRAAREGYLSTYREAVRVQTSASLERNITLQRIGPRLDAVPEGAAAVSASAAPSPPPTASVPPASDDPESAAPSEVAWRLRHLTRTVLRDSSPIDPVAGDDASAFGASGGSASSLFEGALDQSARAATSFFTNTDFDGQVNLLTSSAFAPATSWLPQTWPRGIAYVAVRAPAGSSADWSVRAAMGAGDLPSWTLAGEYGASIDRAHALRVGVSYGTQALLALRDSLTDLPPGGSRSVGGFFAFDHWQPLSAVEIDYGLRLDRYDYVVDPNLISPQISTRIEMLPHTFAVVSLAQRMTAPGADEFLPPSSSGAWLPPERTFSAFVAGAPLQSERIRHYEFGLDRAFGAGDSPVVSVHRFSEATRDQASTLFGLDGASEVGHYYVSVPGSVVVDGWKFGLSGPLFTRVRGRIDYVAGTGRWDDTLEARRLRFAAPSAVRRGIERLQDLSASLEADVPETSTRVAVMYRLDNAFSSADRSRRRPLTDGRFDLEVHQELPYQPIHHGRIDAVFAIRTILHDGEGAFYDELLTVAPPARVTCGFQVKF